MPPPPPPSASYNLVIDSSSSDEDDEAYFSMNRARSYYESTPCVESAPVSPSYLDITPGDTSHPCIDETDLTIVSGSIEGEDRNDQSDDDVEVSAVLVKAKKGKKRKKPKKKKKKKNCTIDSTPERDDDDNLIIDSTPERDDDTNYIIDSTPERDDDLVSPSYLTSPDEISFEHTKIKRKNTSNKSVSFGSVAVREYARTLGTHTVPADGGWPLGISGDLLIEHSQHFILDQQHLNHLHKNTWGRDSPTGSSKHHVGQHISGESVHHLNHPRGWTIDDFESRKQSELQQRYIQLIRDQRRRKFEKEWEKKHANKFHHGHSYNSKKGGKGKKSDSTNGVSGGVRSSSGKLKMEMDDDEKGELEKILAEPIMLPVDEYLETRQYDYKKRVRACKNIDPSITETEELSLIYRGRNPLFGVMKEDDRRRVLLRDEEMHKQCHVTTEKDSSTKDPHPDINDSTLMQKIEHELETLRIQRVDPSNLGCTCRKLHVFLPRSTETSFQKKKGSHRRLPERKVKEELRRRGISGDGMSREKAEQALHDAIEKEPCCWGNDCPCVRSGIGCQADTCSCWHPSHDTVKTTTSSKNGNSESRNVVDQDVHEIETRCGNANGMYVVNFDKIRRHRETFLTKLDTSVGCVVITP